MARLDRVIGYLADTPKLGINIRVKEMKIYGYCDASWACHQDLKGHTGVIVTIGYNGFPIYCKSQKQKVVSRFVHWSRLPVVLEETVCFYGV